MEPLLIQGNIVLVAPNHRPGIVSKDWLNENDILKEVPTNFVHHQNFSLVDTTNFSINVVQQRVTITTRNSDQGILRRLQTIAKRYIKALPNVSYNAIGLNSVWRILPTDPDLLKSTFVADKAKFNEIFHDEAKYDIGGIVRYKYDNSFWAQLTITPQENDQINADYNYHSDITNSDQLSESISRFVEAIQHARKITIKLLGD